MGNKQQELNAIRGGIKFYATELTKTEKEVVMSRADFDLLTAEQLAKHPSGYSGLRFHRLRITNDDQRHRRARLENLKSRAR